MANIFALMILASVTILLGFLIYFPVRWIADAIVERNFAMFLICLVPILMTIGGLGLAFCSK